MNTKAEAVSVSIQQVRLRYMELADVQALFCMENDPEVWQYTDQGDAPYAWAQIDRFVRTAPRDLATHGQLRLLIELGGRVVGAVDLYGYDAAQSQAWVGVLVWPDQQRGRGIGQAALRLLVAWGLPVARLMAKVEQGNGASCGLFLGAGFTEQSRDDRHLFFAYDL